MEKKSEPTEILPQRTTTGGNDSSMTSAPSEDYDVTEEKVPPKQGFLSKFKRRRQHKDKDSNNNNNNDKEKDEKHGASIDPFAHLSKEEGDVLREQVDTVQKNYTYKDLYRYASHFDRFLLIFGVLCSIIGGALLPIMTVIVGTMAKVFAGYFAGTGETTEAEFQHVVNQNALHFFLLGIGVILFTYLSTVIHIDRGEVLTGRIRTHYLRAVLRQNIGFFDKLGPGEVTTLISSDTNHIQEGISEKVGLIFTAFASFFSAFIIGFIMNWRLTLILSSVVFSIVSTMGGATSFVIKFTRLSIAAYGQGGSVAEEVLSSVRNVQAFGVEESSLERYDHHLEIAEGWGRKTQNAVGVMVSFLWTFIYWNYALAFWQGSRYIVDGHADVQDVIAVLFAIIIGAFSLGQAAPHFQSIASATAAGQKILSTIDRIPPIDSYSDKGITLADLEGDIELQHIRFIYPSRPDALVLKDLSLKIPKGNIVALVGASGSGKSTIVGILERFYLPLAGKVLIDGHDINELNIKWLRSQIALVSQEPTLFACSVYENIAHGLIGSPFESEPDDKKRERVIEACKEANAYDFIQALPEGLETSVGDRGFLMSGGQKQRIAIARAIVSQPKILLLDEATSALDTKSEGLVQEALDRASKNRTTIVIAHRLSTIKDANKIVVMSGGEIIEQGTHQELIASHSHYYKLVEAQQIKHRSPDTVIASSNASIDNTVIQTANDDVHSFHMEEKENVLQVSRTGRSVASRQEISQYDIHLRYSISHLVYRIFLLTKGNYRLLAIGMGLSVINGFGYPVLAVLFGECMQSFGLPPSEYGTMRKRINLYSGMFFMLGCVEYIAYQLMFICFSRVGERLVRNVRYLSLKAMLRQDVEFFDRDENSVGSLTGTLSTDAEAIKGLSGATFAQLLNSLVCLFTGIIMSIAIVWKLGLVCTACVPILVGCGFLRVYLLGKIEEKSQKAYSRSAGYACEAVTAIRTVMSLTREIDVCEAYESNVEKQIVSDRLSTLQISIWYGFSQGLTLWVAALGFWYGAGQLKTHSMSLFGFYVAFTAVIFGAQTAGAVFSYAPDMGKAREAARSIVRLLDFKPTHDAFSKEGKRLESVKGDIEFKDVHFRYPTRYEVPVLRGLNLSIKPGQYVALVGPSGCGKSTTISLIERFYDPILGEISIDGVNTSELNLANYRSFISLVQQEPILYAGTLRENILMGLADGDNCEHEQVVEVCRQANIHEFIMSLPDGYDTFVGTKGTLLSGGQKQRVAIARALIRNPRILLLDEATSALDSESEKVVQAALDKAAQGRTTVAVAHRLSTIQNADMIYVFDGGVIVENGTHNELLALNGRYSELVRMQALEDTR